MKYNLSIKIVVLKNIIFLIVLFSSNLFLAQTRHSSIQEITKKRNSNEFLVIEKPQFPAPEKEVLFFFSESYFLNLQHYFGNVKEVQYAHTIYKLDKSILSSDTSKIVYKNHQIKNLEISAKPILDFIGIDSISKNKETLQLFHFDEAADYVHQVYELKDDQIIHATENTNVLIYQTDYTYHKNRKLIKISSTDDYGHEEIKTATYNKNGRLMTKKIFNENDGVHVLSINYRYKNSLLVKVERHETVYFLPDGIEKKSIDKIDYSLYTDNETFVQLNTVHLAYNENSKLSAITEIDKGFSKKEGVTYQKVRKFTLTYKPNKLLIIKSLKEKRAYEYVFDRFKNPKEINVYLIDKKIAWLDKKISFKITYVE